MSNPDNGSYISRFLVKFVEITAAGLATAASGYMIAHLSATLSSSTPTTNNGAVVATPNFGDRAAEPAQPVTRSSADSGQKAIVPQLTAPADPPPGAPQAATTTANILKPEAPSRRIENSPKPATSTRESWTVRVRAALANAAHRSDPAADSPRRSRPPAGVAEPGPVIDSANSHAVSATPAAPEVRPPPLQETTIVASPPNVTEVNPVVPIQPSPAPSEKAPGALSTLEQMLRNDPLAGSDQAPRPPMPVGQE